MAQQGGYAEFKQDETSATITLHRPARDKLISNGVIPMLRGTLERHRDRGFHGLIQVGALMSEGSGQRVQANINCPPSDGFTAILREIESELIVLNALDGTADLIVRIRLIVGSAVPTKVIELSPAATAAMQTLLVWGIETGKLVYNRFLHEYRDSYGDLVLPDDAAVLDEWRGSGIIEIGDHNKLILNTWVARIDEHGHLVLMG